jgi:hypothetical protein
MTKGIEIKDLIVGTGEEATKDRVVVANIREFLRRGDEVSPSPLFGARHIIDLGRRECIAGLRHGIAGMRVGGKREVIISPHLAYGEKGVPGLIPANALLRCEVELLEIREHSALLPQDYLPGKVLLLHRNDADESGIAWGFSLHENGNSRLTVRQTTHDEQNRKQSSWRQVPIALGSTEAGTLVGEAIELPKQIPENCVDWNSGFIDQQKGGSVILDRRNGARCLYMVVSEDGRPLLTMGVHEDSPKFCDSGFYRTIEQLIRPHLDQIQGGGLSG